MKLADAVTHVVVQLGGVRAAAKATGISAPYISRLCSGAAEHPGDELLEKLGLRRTVFYDFDDDKVNPRDSAYLAVRPFLKSRKRADTIAKALHAHGYAGVSNRYGAVARIDRPDWAEKMIASAPWHLAPSLDRNQAYSLGDSFIRTLSKDRIEGVDTDVYRELRRLHVDPLSYINPLKVFLA